MSFERGFRAKANRISLGVRERLGLRAIDPIDPRKVCEFFEIELIDIRELECDCSAFLGKDSSLFSAVTVPRGIKTAIAHNPVHHENRVRSNICHELAHSFLGHKHMPPLTPSGERNLNSGIEGEANYLAGTLLIPNEAAKHIVLSGINGSAADIYGVSSSMLKYRLQVSGANSIGKRVSAKYGKLIRNSEVA